MTDYHKRIVNFGLGKSVVIENVIAPYEPMSNPAWKAIKHPSQEFMIKVKNFSSFEQFNEIEMKIIHSFRNSIIEAIQTTKEYRKKAYIVFPPTKEGKNNQVISIFKAMNIPGDYETIELKSGMYTLKGKNKKARKSYLTDNYKKWVFWNGPHINGEKKDSFFIFVDDVLTLGNTSYFTLKALQHIFKLKEMPLYRSVYLMGTKPTGINMLEHSFEKELIWDSL